jgi:hypothetical protein
MNIPGSFFRTDDAGGVFPRRVIDVYRKERHNWKAIFIIIINAMRIS